MNDRSIPSVRKTLVELIFNALPRGKQCRFTQPRFSVREVWSGGSSDAAANEVGLAAWIRARLDEVCSRQFLIRYLHRCRLRSNCTANGLLAVPFEISFGAG